MNLITEQTKKRLEKELKKNQELLIKIGKNMGEAFGDDCDWHDNSAADFAVEEFKRVSVIVQKIKNKLRNYKIIEPCEDTSKVNIGNKVILEVSGELKEYTILGEGDFDKDKGWIAYKSPIVQVIIGAKKGEQVKFKDSVIKILDIKKGEF